MTLWYSYHPEVEHKICVKNSENDDCLSSLWGSSGTGKTVKESSKIFLTCLRLRGSLPSIGNSSSLKETNATISRRRTKGLSQICQQPLCARQDGSKQTPSSQNVTPLPSTVYSCCRETSCQVGSAPADPGTAVTWDGTRVQGSPGTTTL